MNPFSKPGQFVTPWLPGVADTGQSQPAVQPGGGGGGGGAWTPRNVSSALVAGYDCLQGASPNTVYDVWGPGNDAVNGLGPGSFQAAFGATGLTFTDSLVALPTSQYAAHRSATFLLTVTPQPTTPQFLIGDTGANSVFFDSGTADCGGSLALQANQYTPVLGVPDQVSGTRIVTIDFAAGRIYLEGVETPAYFDQGTYTPSGTPTRFWVGRAFSPGYGFVGVLHYLLVYNRSLSATERSGETAFLRRVAAQRGLSVGTTWGKNRKLAAFAGDSLTSGVGGYYGGEYWAQTSALLTSHPAVVQYGVGGQTSAQLLANQAARSGAIFPLYSGATKAFVLWIGDNDLNASIAPATIFANINTAVAAAKASGATDVAVLCVPNRTTTSNPSYSTDQATLNGLINGGTGYTPLDPVAGMGNPNAGDGIHFDATKYAVPAGLVKTWLNSIGIA